MYIYKDIYIYYIHTYIYIYIYIYILRGYLMIDTTSFMLGNMSHYFYLQKQKDFTSNKKTYCKNKHTLKSVITIIF